jgi:phosphohistidine phosphatase
VAQRLSQLGIGFDLLLSSPLVRAYETAEILVYQGLAPYFTRHDALAPGGDLADWLTWLGDWQVNQPESAPWRSSVTSRT